METNHKFTSVDEYISAFPLEIQERLHIIRKTIKKIAPSADELISYNMPAFKIKRILVYYAAHKNHIGFYPASVAAIQFFKNDLINFETSKGTIQFAHNKDLPIDLIEKIVKFRLVEIEEKLKKK